jgi:hypothetical protein
MLCSPLASLAALTSSERVTTNQKGTPSEDFLGRYQERKDSFQNDESFAKIIGSGGSNSASSSVIKIGSCVQRARWVHRPARVKQRNIYRWEALHER